jgi:hypothetical protein
MDLLEGITQDAPAISTEPTSVGDKEKASITNNETWLSGLDESLKQDPTISRFKDPGSLAKSYVELRKSLGKSEIPNEKSTPEEVQAFYRKAGIPDKDKYNVDAKKYGLADDVAAQIKEIASTSGVTEHGLSKIFDLIQEKDIEAKTQMQEEMRGRFTEEVNALKKEYGPAFNKYLNLGNEVAKEIYTPEEMASLKEQGVSNNPLFAKLLMSMAKSKFGEDIVDDEHTKQGFVATPDQVQAKINEILNDKDFSDTKSPRHKTLTQEFERLHILKQQYK